MILRLADTVEDALVKYEMNGGAIPLMPVNVQQLILQKVSINTSYEGI